MRAANLVLTKPRKKDIDDMIFFSAITQEERH